MPALRSRRTGGESVIADADGHVLVRIPTEVSEQIEFLLGRLSIQRPELPSSLVVTSHLSGEGVSLVSAALAAAVGRTHRACLIEANWESGRLPSTAGVGLADAIAGTTSIESSTLASSRSGLSIMPAGDLAALSNRIPVGARLGPILKALQTTHDMVVIDTPGMAGSPFALEAAAIAEASILVVRQGVTDKEQVEHSAARLAPFGFRGVVLNANRLSTPALIRRWGSGQ